MATTSSSSSPPESRNKDAAPEKDDDDGVDHDDDGLKYLAGFGNSFESEVLEGALPKGRSTPRLVPFHLYTEQLSGTAFTAPRHTNRRTWLYRIQPGVTLTTTTTTTGGGAKAKPLHVAFGGVHPSDCQPHVDPLRWNPLPGTTQNPDEDDGTGNPDDDTDFASRDFVSGTKLMCAAGDPAVKHGISIYLYAFGLSMSASSTAEKHFCNADGDLLVIPQHGTLEVITELGKLCVKPTEIVVVPRGIVFQVNLVVEGTTTEDNTVARGYVLECYGGGGFQLPELGPIGSNGLANARDFLHPTAWCVEDREAYRKPCRIVYKTDSYLFEKASDHSPFNVVAWHGNYLPYKYDLKKFCAVNSVTYDHLDPSIYTVLTCQTDRAGTALADFVIFPPRVMATDANTLRPPWFHRNTMSEYMGLIYGEYDAKARGPGGGGFVPGGASLHNTMVPHGPDAATYRKAVADECKTCARFDAGLAFMFESCLPMRVSPLALQSDSGWLDNDYAACWQGLDDQFTGWDALANKAKKNGD